MTPNTQSILPILFALLVSVSCNKPDDNRLEDVTDTIVGRYKCVSVTVQGTMLDINGDGISENDLVAEFKDFWLASDRIAKLPAPIQPIKSVGERKSILIDVPKQRVFFNKTTSEYYIKDIYSGDSMMMSFDYTVDEDFNIITTPVEREDLIQEDYDTIHLIAYRDNKCISLIFDGKGRFEALINCTFYDFVTDKMVTVPVIYIYERYSCSYD